jgi:hypothetical protein
MSVLCLSVAAAPAPTPMLPYRNSPHLREVHGVSPGGCLVRAQVPPLLRKKTARAPCRRVRALVSAPPSAKDHRCACSVRVGLVLETDTRGAGAGWAQPRASASVGTSKRPTRTQSRLITVRHACVTITVRGSEAHKTDHEGSHSATCCIVTGRWDCAASQRICLVSWSADLLETARSFTCGFSAGLTVAELAAAAGSRNLVASVPARTKVLWTGTETTVPPRLRR